jgi:hypothetical protein
MPFVGRKRLETYASVILKWFSRSGKNNVERLFNREQTLVAGK